MKAEKKKRSGLFMKVALCLAGLWTLAAAAVVVYFHARGNPLDPTVVGILFAPGVGEFGFSAIIKSFKEKADADKAREKAEEAQAEADELRAELEAIAAQQAAAETANKKLKSDLDKAKRERDKALGEAAALQQRLTPLEELIRQNVQA